MFAPGEPGASEVPKVGMLPATGVVAVACLGAGLDIVCLRALVMMGTPFVDSTVSLRIATTAARFAAVPDTDLRRVTRWCALSELPMIECELLREWTTAGRCRLGLEEVCISFENVIVSTGAGSR
jgi:hypothetical protein